MNENPVTSTPAAIRTVSLVKTYSLGKKNIEVLKGVDITVSQREIVALLGASGTGKSTLLHIIGGLDTPDSGSVECGGHHLHAMKERDLSGFRNRCVGFVFQSYHLLPELTALENVCLPGRIARRPAGEVRDRAAGMLEKVGLGHRLDHRPYEMSGGEQQRTSIARALINDPQFLLADEPTGNLDSKTGREIFELMVGLRDSLGLTMVVATHDRSLAGTTDRIIYLDDGRVDTGALNSDG